MGGWWTDKDSVEEKIKINRLRPNKVYRVSVTAGEKLNLLHVLASEGMKTRGNEEM